MVRYNFSVSSIYLWKKCEIRKKINIRDFNFKKGFFAARLPKALTLYTTSLENNAQTYFYSGDSSDSRMKAQFPPSVRISKYRECGAFPSVETLPETCRPTSLPFFTGLNKQKLYILFQRK